MRIISLPWHSCHSLYQATHGLVTWLKLLLFFIHDPYTRTINLYINRTNLIETIKPTFFLLLLLLLHWILTYNTHFCSSIALLPYSLLETFSSCCPPITNSLMTIGPILLTNGTPARQETFTWSSSFIQIVIGFILFDILTLIRGLVIFMLHYHQYFYRDTTSRWLLTKAEIIIIIIIIIALIL